jgi:hypothetical protein
MSDSLQPVNSRLRTRVVIRWALIALLLACIVGALYFVLQGGSARGPRANDSSGTSTGQLSGVDYTGRWVSVEEITKPDAGPFGITELNVTNDRGLLSVEVRGQKVDTVVGGIWTQQVCPEACLLGLVTTTYRGEPMTVSLATQTGVTHTLALSLKPAAPGSDEMLSLVDTVTFGGKTLATSTEQFVPHAAIHNVRIMDTGLPQLR